MEQRMNTPGNADWMPDFEDPEKHACLEAHHLACECRERAMLEILVLVEPIMEAWAKSHELDEWHCRVENLIGTAYPSFIEDDL
jgi:hypothetical protein